MFVLGRALVLAILVPVSAVARPEPLGSGASPADGIAQMTLTQFAMPDAALQGLVPSSIHVPWPQVDTLGNGLSLAFERAAGVARRPALTARCSGASRVSASQSGMRFREQTARGTDDAATQAAMLASLQQQAASLSLLFVPGLRQCTAGLDAGSSVLGNEAAGQLQVNGDFSLIEDKSAAALEATRITQDSFSVLSIDYMPSGIPLGPLRYKAGISVDGSYSTSRRDGLVSSTRQTGLSARHGLNWSSAGRASVVSASITQTARRTIDATDPQSGELEHALRLSWLKPLDGGGRAALSASLSQSGTTSPEATAESSGRGLSVLAHYDQPLSSNSSFSADVNMLKSLRRTYSPTAEALFAAFGGNGYQLTKTSFQSASASYRYLGSLESGRLTFTASLSIYRSEINIDSFGLIRSSLARSTRAIAAGIDYVGSRGVPTLSVRTQTDAAGTFSIAAQLSKEF